MASKRNLRRRACEGKVRYASKDEAERVGRALRLHAYACPHCSGFHNGHPPGPVKQGLAAKRKRDEFRGRMQTPAGAR